MSDPECKSLESALLELEKVAPDAPLLALGQTIFWDEPMKAGVAIKMRKLGMQRKFVAGIHDSDYFAKIPSGRGGKERFKTLPHNDTSTRGLWSAAGEFSALFGSETVVTRDALLAAGVRVESVVKQRPKFLDEVTEAWGWRGIVSLDERPPVTAELPMDGLYPELVGALKWATDLSLESIGGGSRESAKSSIQEMFDKLEATDHSSDTTLSQFYRELLPFIYEFTSGFPVPMETTTTTELLKFNRSTFSQPRFKLLELFVDSKTRQKAITCYDDAIRGSAGLYELSRFGTGSIPFDMIIPNEGRGTIRLGNRGAVIMTPNRKFLSFKKPLTSLEELAELVEAKFGPDCVIVGKAVSLIGMLGREFVFVFHEGASAYVKHSRTMHRLILERLGVDLNVHPLLRVRYSAWDALGVCCSWLKLPEVIARPFATEELCAPSFASRWKNVRQEQIELLAALSTIRRPIELIRYLDKTLGGFWQKLAEEYESLYGRLLILRNRLKDLDQERDRLYAKMRELQQARVRAEKEKGVQFRAQIFEKKPDETAQDDRAKLSEAVADKIHAITELRHALHKVRRQQHELAQDVEIRSIYARRRSIELEAELKRTRLVRSAIVASSGLDHAAVRPSAWWFPLVCPDGLWFRETIETAEAYLEPLR